MRVSELTNTLFNRLNVLKRGSRLKFSKQVLFNYLATINTINKLGRDNIEVVSGNNTDRYLLVDALKDMIYPNSITVTGNRAGKDYIDRDHVVTDVLSIGEADKVETIEPEILKASEFNNVTEGIINSVSVELKTVNVQSLRTDKLITDIAARVSYNSECNYNGFYYPIPIIENIYKADSYYNMSEKEMFEEWVNTILKC